MDTVIEITRKNGVATVKLLSGDALRVPSALFLERRLRVGENVDPKPTALIWKSGKTPSPWRRP